MTLLKELLTEDRTNLEAKVIREIARRAIHNLKTEYGDEDDEYIQAMVPEVIAAQFEELQFETAQEINRLVMQALSFK